MDLCFVLLEILAKRTWTIIFDVSEILWIVGKDNPMIMIYY